MPVGDYLYPLVGTRGTITSRIGARKSPGGIGSTNHAGYDIAAPIGTGVIAPVSGTVLSAGRGGGYGNLVQIRDDAGNLLKFGHLSAIDVKAGQTVTAGQRIGAVGSTGNSTGPHLHYEGRDSKGNVIDLLKKGSNLVSTGAAILGVGATGPLAPIAAGAGLLGLGGGTSWLEDIKNWLKESDFFKRLAIGLFGLIVLIAAFYLMKETVDNKMTLVTTGNV